MGIKNPFFCDDGKSRKGLNKRKNENGINSKQQKIVYINSRAIYIEKQI